MTPDEISTFLLRNANGNIEELLKQWLPNYFSLEYDTTTNTINASQYVMMEIIFHESDRQLIGKSIQLC